MSFVKVFAPLLIATLSFGDASDKKTPNAYNPVGKRDPFRILSASSTGRKISAIYPTEKYDLDQLNLKAILRIEGKSRAMIEAPDGQTFIVREGETVGRERATLSRILKTEIIFSQQTFNYLGNASLVERVLSLPPDASGGGGDSPMEVPTKGQEPKSEKKANKVAEQPQKQEGQINMGDVLGNAGNNFNANIQKIMNRPNQLEKEIDEIVGQPQK